ncbi:MAG: YihY/virulence factor BrkB family protein, partial [Myxococcales bacterium]
SKLLEIARPLVDAATLDELEPTLMGLAQNQGASVTLLIGVLGALWSASAYVGAFGRAMNKILEVEEGRPFWKLRPTNLFVTLVTILLCMAGLLILVVSGPVAESIGSSIGLEDTSVRVWEIAKWPVLALIVVVAVATLYRFTPNVKLKFRVLTTGAFVAIVVWLLASVGFAFYVGNFGNYNKTYGAVAGVVVGLLWLWITNLALLFGAELDSEIKRARQLHDGLPAEDNLQVEMRDDKGVKKAHARRQKDILEGKAVRDSHLGPGEHGDRPFQAKSR